LLCARTAVASRLAFAEKPRTLLGPDFFRSRLEARKKLDRDALSLAPREQYTETTWERTSVRARYPLPFNLF
jgi:hypothetical protein